MSFAEIGLDLARTHIFGILNVTPDSFSDGGNFLDPEQAILQAKKLKNEGADVIDVGGESTRPGAVRISAQEELKRVLPVIAALSSENYLVSIDTTRAEVAEAAVIAGAKIVNDVSGGRSDPLMFKKVSDLNVAYILMHWRAQSKQMDDLAIYKDVINEVSAEINSQIALALAAGIKKENLAIDPGLGFAKNPQHNWDILNNIDKIKNIGFPVLVGHSRKRFISELTPNHKDDMEYKDSVTAAITYQLALNGIWAVRVHQAKPNLAAISTANRLKPKL